MHVEQGSVTKQLPGYHSVLAEKEDPTSITGHQWTVWPEFPINITMVAGTNAMTGANRMGSAQQGFCHHRCPFCRQPRSAPSLSWRTIS